MAYKKNRAMKVYETLLNRQSSQSWIYGSAYSSVPQIRLQGKWLAELGFTKGSPINVECDEGKLIITLNK